MPEDNTIATPTPSMPPVDSNVAPVADAVGPEPAASKPVASEPAVNSSVVVEPLSSDELTSTNSAVADPEAAVRSEVASKIRDAKNVLIALSGDPSVDEMAAAIGLSLYLDKLGKRATAIYSGATPNALEFLKPGETFEPTADTLQDFVIALNKDKADHLRYKLDGDYVKIYITPYKTKITEDDLEFSYGDFNVDLVLALDVANGIDLDSALREHGRIMHDAVIINITTGNPGKFGEIEWSDKHASSVSEMIAELLYSVASDKIDKEEATAFLTGIVAATDRFSNGSTTPDTMQIASKLMESGANQQLIAKNITSDVENEMFSLSGAKETKKSNDAADLKIEHEAGNDIGESALETADDAADEKRDDKTADEKSDDADSDDSGDSGLLEDLKAAAASLAQAGVNTTPEADRVALKIGEQAEPVTNGAAAAPEVGSASTAPTSDALAPSSEPAIVGQGSVAEPDATVSEPSAATAGLSTATVEPAGAEEDAIREPMEEKVLQPSADFDSTSVEDENKYSKMLEDALESVGGANGGFQEAIVNPAAASAPAVASTPEINGVPEMNYMPSPNEEILPPPPTPPIDMSTVTMPAAEPEIPAVQPVAPVAEPVVEASPAPVASQPAAQSQTPTPQATDPSAFRIPGM